MKKINHKSLITLLLCFISLLSSYVMLFHVNNSTTTQVAQNKTLPNSSQTQGQNQFYTWKIVENRTTTYNEPYLIFNFDSNIDLRIGYQVAGRDSPTRKSQILSEARIDIFLDAGSNNVTIPIRVNIAAFPGEYYYGLFISIYNQADFEIIGEINIIQGIVRLNMGGSWSIILAGISMVGLFIVLSKEETLREEPSDVKNTAEVYNPTLSSSPIDQINQSTLDTSSEEESVETGFIKCPDCKKKIKEGSAFCPECGYHIPKFLRINQG